MGLVLAPSFGCKGGSSEPEIVRTEDDNTGDDDFIQHCLFLLISFLFLSFLNKFIVHVGTECKIIAIIRKNFLGIL